MMPVCVRIIATTFYFLHVHGCGLTSIAAPVGALVCVLQAAWAAPVEVLSADAPPRSFVLYRRSSSSGGGEQESTTGQQVLDFCERSGLGHDGCIQLLRGVERRAATPSGCIPAGGDDVCGAPVAIAMAPPEGPPEGVGSPLAGAAAAAYGSSGRGERLEDGSFLWRRARVAPAPCVHYWRLMRPSVGYFVPEFVRGEGAHAWELVDGGREARWSCCCC